MSMKHIFYGARGNHGDTIVEVLIAMAVVSLVLSGAYASSNRSAQATRTAQERGEATKFAESQVEQVKVAVDGGTVLPASFCFGDTGAVKTLPADAADCKTTGGVEYRRSIDKSSNDYTVKVQWDALTRGTNIVQLDYRSKL